MKRSEMIYKLNKFIVENSGNVDGEMIINFVESLDMLPPKYLSCSEPKVSAYLSKCPELTYKEPIKTVEEFAKLNEIGTLRMDNNFQPWISIPEGVYKYNVITVRNWEPENE